MLSGNFHHSSRFYYFTHEPLEPEPEVEQTGKKNKDKLFTLLVDTGNMCVWRGGEGDGRVRREFYAGNRKGTSLNTFEIVSQNAFILYNS